MEIDEETLEIEDLTQGIPEEMVIVEKEILEEVETIGKGIEITETGKETGKETGITEIERETEKETGRGTEKEIEITGTGIIETLEIQETVEIKNPGSARKEQTVPMTRLSKSSLKLSYLICLC